MATTQWDFGPTRNTDPTDRARAQLEAIERSVRMAMILTKSGRQIDLTGLDQQIGLLCAQTLDLGWQLARGLRPKLAGLLAELDALAKLQHIDEPA